MPKTNKKSKLKLPILVRIIAVFMILLAISLLGMVLTSLYLHFFGGYPIPQNVAWAANLLFLFIVSVLIIMIAIGLFFRKNYARILAVITLFIIAILNLRAEILVFSFPQSLMSLMIYTLFFLSGLYLLFSKRIRKVFS